MKSYSLMVTYDCNWNCGFCIVDTHNKPKVTSKELREKVDGIEPNSEVSLSGGEPGLLNKEDLEYCIRELKKKKCEITVNTNGTFFKNYPEYCDEIDAFYYHCTEDLDTSKGIMLDGVPINKTKFMMVLTDDNFERLEWFLDTYPNIRFEVASATKAIVNNKIGTSLSPKNAFFVWIKFKDRITKESMLYLLESCVIVNEKYEIK